MPLSPKKTVSLNTLGCKLNQYDSEVILTQFRTQGFEITEHAEDADICIVNTCAVTDTAERKAKWTLRALHRKNPEAELYAVGCMAERNPEALASIPGVTRVLGNREKQHILDFVNFDETKFIPEIHVGETKTSLTWSDGLSVNGLLGRTRAFLKIQDGCSQKCTYCIVPQLRGNGKSLDLNSVLDRAKLLADQGFLEIVITGVALGTYGFDFGKTNCLAAVLEALEKVQGIKRIRLGSVEPWAVTDELLTVIANSEKVCPHLHIPLQSAENSVLRRMNRRYTVEQIAHLFDYAFKLRDDWGFGSDIIIGFPGEKPQEFDSTITFLSNSPLSYLHIFPFSLRPGTPAAKLNDHISDTEKHERVELTRLIDRNLRERFFNKNIHTVQSVLFENRRSGNYIVGHSANYLDVFVKAKDNLRGSLQKVQIKDLHPGGVRGEILTKETRIA